MRKPIYSCVIAALCLTIFAKMPLAAQEQRALTQTDLEWIVRNMDWVFQGLVTSVEVRLAAPVEVWGHGSSECVMVITEITMRNLKVIAGEYDGDEIAITLPEGEKDGLVSGIAGISLMRVNVGDSAILGIMSNRRGTPVNVSSDTTFHRIETPCKMLNDRTAFFKIDGTDLVPYQREYRLAVEKPLEVIAAQAKMREMPELFRAADLVCIATVTRLLAAGRATKEVEVSIGETLKGTPERQSIAVDVSGVNRSFEHQRPGYQALLFLKRIGATYKPVDGVNGYYLLEGDTLYRGFTLPLRAGMDEWKNVMEVWSQTD